MFSLRHEKANCLHSAVFLPALGEKGPLNRKQGVKTRDELVRAIKERVMVWERGGGGRIVGWVYSNASEDE